MNWIAWKMLTGDRSKYFGIIFGIAFAALLMAQQSSIFVGLMRNTTSQIRDVQGFDIWVMDKNVQFIDDLKPMSDNELQRVRGVEGVDWAVRFYKGLGRAKLDDGNYQQVILLGLDDSPTKRYGPQVEGAGIHHNPTPGPADSKFLYGHVWVTLCGLAWHPLWGVIALPLLARLYIRACDVPKLWPGYRWKFQTKLEQAAELVEWAAR